MLSMFSHEIEINDSMLSNAYGHVHHAESIKLIEQGRNAYLVSKGLPHESLHTENIYIVVTNIHAEYLREVKKGKHFSRVLALMVKGKNIIVTQDLIKESGKVCVKAEVTLVCMSGTLRRTVAIPEKLLSFLVISQDN